MTHQRGHKGASHDVCVCVHVAASHSALKCVQYYTLQKCFPAKELHSRYIDCQHLMCPLKVCRMQSARSTVVRGQYWSGATEPHWCRAGQRGGSLQTAVVMKDKCLPGVKFPFYCFLAQDIIHCLICCYVRLICFWEGWPEFSWFFLFWRERLHNSLKAPMRNFLIACFLKTYNVDFNRADTPAWDGIVYFLGLTQCSNCPIFCV